MRWLATSVGVAALLGSALGQEEGVPVKICDALNRCFETYHVEEGPSYGIAIPSNATAAPFDVIIQITAPKTIGWAGFAWGGAMTYNPLAIAWVNGNEVAVSSRMGFGYFVPAAYADAKYTILPGTMVNATHFQVTALCKGCSSWAPFDADPMSLIADGENYLAFAFSNSPVDDPKNDETTFAIHDRVGHWVHDFKPAQSEQFATWAAAAGGAAPPAPGGGNATTTAAPASSTATSAVTSATSSAANSTVATTTQTSTTLATVVTSSSVSSTAAATTTAA